MAPERQLAELTERLEALAEELAETRAERQRLVHELTERSRAQAQARDEVAALEQRLIVRERELSTRGRATSAQELATAMRDLDRELGARLAELSASRAEIEALRSEAEERDDELSDRLEQTEQELTEAQHELVDVRARLDAARGVHANDEAELAKARARIERLHTDVATARARVNAVHGEVERAHDETRIVRDALDAERSARASIEGRLLWHEQQLRAREAELAAAARTIERLEEAQAERDRMREEMRSLREQRDQIVAQRDEFATQRDEFAAQRDEFAAQRRAALKQRDEVEAQRKRVSGELSARTREHQQLVGDLSLRLADVRADVERISASRVWRWGHRIARTLRALTFRKPITQGAVNRAIKRLDEATAAIGSTAPRRAPAKRTAEPDDADEKPHPAADTAGRTKLARAIRERLGPVTQLAEWPRVSIVVLNRNGAGYLRTLFAGLSDATDYPDFEVIVIDNASTDDSLEFLRASKPGFPVSVIANETNASFSEANNQAAAVATGQLLLFANNDIEPFESGWLRELVACQKADRVAVGATLLYGEGRQPKGTAPYAVQHRGISFRLEDGLPRAFNAGGDDPLGPALGADAGVPAVTAACLLIARDLFDSVGGFTGGYRYGTEDVDLGLKLRVAGAAVVCSGRSVVLHHESATQEAEGRDFMRANRTVNRRLFLERWAPQLKRHVALDRLRGGGQWTSERPLHVAITRTSNDVRDGWGDWYTAHELGEALEALGWQVSFVQRKGDDWYSLPADADYLLVLMDNYDLPRAAGRPAIAWVRNWTDRWLEHEWFDDLHVVLASSRASASLIEAATGRVAPLFPLATNPDRFRSLPVDPKLRADYVFTGNYWGAKRELQDAIDPHPGERFTIHGKGWDQVPELARWAHGPTVYEKLPAVYSSARVVIDDTAGPTLPYGAVNTRVFDALASGAAVVTNCESGVRELFDDDFPVWNSRESLRAQLDRLLGDEAVRNATVERYRARVLAEHTYPRRAAQLEDELRRRIEATSFCIKIGAPDRAQAERWGDLHFARGLRRQLERRGHPCMIQTLDEWENESGLTYDVVIQLKGLSRYRPKPGQFNVLWVISHPDVVTPEECDGFDLVAVASERFAAELRELTQTPVVVLEQATDPDVFFPEPTDQFRHEIAYVGNSRNVMRKALADLLPTDRDLAVYGSNWAGLIDQHLVVAEHITNAELHKVYASAGVVLNDHWDDMRRHGFVSNRIYDVLASGGVVVSDYMPELEQFGDAVVTYREAGELKPILERLLKDPSEQERRRAAGRELVLETSTFAQRAETLLQLIAEQMQTTRLPASIVAAAAPPTPVPAPHTR